MVIDFHAHCFADSIAASAIKKLEAGADVAAVHDGTAEGLVGHMALCGVDKSVVLPVATKPSQVRRINEWACGAKSDKLTFYGALHPDDEDFYSSAERVKESGFRGVKLHPDYQHFYADEPRMMPLYEALRDLGLVLVLHAGIDIGYPVPVHCTPVMIRKIADNIPGLTIVAAHMGSYSLWRDVDEFLTGLPIYFDTSFSHHALGGGAMADMIRRHGAERVLFGTDSPWKRADDEIAAVRSLNLPADDIDKILYKNALALI
ncbi:MAG: amidohydrolase family protein [Christensenellales bacterium]